jgi:NAD(P)-dependent dehydrogenase (short-subunit alcohol dehydrogenase family)
MARDDPPREPVPPFPARQQPGLEADLRSRPRHEAEPYRPAGKLEGKVALITGGDSGIGRAVAVIFAKEKADVAIVYLPQAQRDADETRAAVGAAGRRCLLLPGDVSDPDFCLATVARTVDELGRLDVLVNNAAVQKRRDGLLDLPLEQWERTFRTNVNGCFTMVRAAVPRMKRGGAIVNVGSIAGLEGSAKLLDYSATMGAIHAFTKSLARNLLDEGIRVNCVVPGTVWTPLDLDRPTGDVARFGSGTPMGRPAQPEEIAPAFVYLASNADSSYVTGEILTLLGGATRAA